MRVAIVAVGSELLSTERLDTNSLKIAAVLERYGAALVAKVVVGDDESELGDAIGYLLARVDLLIVSGGLGPTADDVTREAVADLLGRRLERDPEALSAIEARFAKLGRRMAETNRKQADRIAGAVLLANPRGTAPGQRIDTARGAIFLVPGVPFEMEAMLEREIAPWIAERSGGVASASVWLRLAMRPESEVDQAIGPLYAEFGREWITILASPGEVKLRLTAVGGDEERSARLATMRARALALLGDTVYGEGEQESLEAVVGRLLVARGERVATAESCTGGLLAERLTRVAGSSAYFPGALVAYANVEKERGLGVPHELLETHGAVSEPVARAMAVGARARFGTEWAVAITGVAGPGGGSTEKPVGAVHLAVAGPDDTCAHLFVRLPGNRERIRFQATQSGLELLRRCLLGLDLRSIGFQSPPPGGDPALPSARA